MEATSDGEAEEAGQADPMAGDERREPANGGEVDWGVSTGRERRPRGIDSTERISRGKSNGGPTAVANLANTPMWPRVERAKGARSRAQLTRKGGCDAHTVTRDLKVTGNAQAAALSGGGRGGTA